MKKKLYAFYDQHGKFIRNKQFDKQEEVDAYLNDMYRKNRSLMAIHLSGSTRKIDARKRKKLEIAIRNNKSWFNPKDLKQMNMLVSVLKEKPARYGMVIGAMLDTALREIIPLTVWEAMGGEVNKK